MARVPWFRMYSEVLHDPKVQRLPVALRWRWVEILCLANEQEPRGRLPAVRDVAFALRLSEAKAYQSVIQLLDAGLLDRDENDEFWPHNWENRQFASDARDTEGRKAADEARRKRGGKWENPAAKARRVGGDPAVTEQSRDRAETETEQIAETEQTRAQEFEPVLTNSQVESEPGFVGQYSRHYEKLHGRLCPSGQAADAADIERLYGFDACMQVAQDTNWEKPPAWLKPKLAQRAEKADVASQSEPVQSRRFRG